MFILIFMFEFSLYFLQEDPVRRPSTSTNLLHISRHQLSPNLCLTNTSTLFQLPTHSGIGKEVLHELARKKKDKVYMDCGDMRKCEEERKNIVLDTRNKLYCRWVEKGCVGVTCHGYPQ